VTVLDMLACILPGEGYHAPQARHPVDDVPCLLEPEALPLVKSRTLSAVAPRPAHVARAQYVRELPDEIVLAALGDVPGATTKELRTELRRRGWRGPPQQVRAALVDLERRRKVRCVVMRSRRDVERAGGKWIWEVMT
jgi:hypothetical protein